MDADRFDDVRLAAGGIRGRAHQGGPVSGASAHVQLGEASPGRPRRSFTWPFGPVGRCPDPQLFLVIHAPTWSLTRKVGAGRERWASLFAAAVNTAARRADATTWSPTLITATATAGDVDS